MYSPGTIKAIGLMSKGVSADRAFAHASQVDLQSAQTRVNFYTEESLKSPLTMSFATSTAAAPLPSAPSTPTPSTKTAPVTPPGQATQAVAQTTQPSSTTTVSKTFDDLIKEGYKRNTGDGSYLQTPNSPKIAPVSTAAAPPSQRKLKTFYDQKFLPTPEDELERETLRLNHPLKNLSPELYKQIPSISSSQWGLTDPDAIRNAAADALAKYLTKPMSLPYEFQSPEQVAETKDAQDQAYRSMKGVVSNFLKASNLSELTESKKIIDNQFKLLLDKADNIPITDAQTLANMPQGAAMNISYSETSAKQKSKADLLEVKNALDETYKNEYISKVSWAVKNELEKGALEATDIDQYLKSLDGYKDAAGGLFNFAGGLSDNLAGFADLIKKSHNESYFDRPLTQADIDLGGQKVLNEQALARFNEKSNLSFGEAVLESRYDETRNHIVDTHFKLGSGIIEAFTKEKLFLLKEREALISQINSPELSPKRAKEIETELKEIEKFVELNDKLIDKTGELHNYNALKQNKEIKNFAGSFLDEQESLAKESKKYYSGEMSFLEKGLFVSQKTSQYLASGAAKLVTESIQGIGSMGGWDGLETAGRYATNYVTPRELVNFDLVNNKGNYQTSNTFMFKDNEGENHYQPFALLYTGAEMTPLVVATVYGASGLSSLGGRALAKSSSTLVSNGLMSAKRASDFSRALATTKNYGAAYRTVLSQSANPLVQALAYDVPRGAALGAIVYPQQFAHAYNDMYTKGIKDARSKAHAIAAVSTAIEILTENMYNELKYLDDFAEKGVGMSSFAKKYGSKWTGSLNQYRTLYGDVFGKTFSGKTLDYLAVNSVNALGKAGAAGRFMLVRGIEEGREEVTSELMNYFANNHMGLAAMKGEPPTEISTEGLINTFVGALIGPPIGVSNQLKKYSENKKYGQLFDIMLNGQFYQNKVNQAVKAGKMKEADAAQVLAKIQELDSIEKEYGVKNLKNFASPKSIKTLNDLMEDPYLQFDYFKNILQKKSIDDRLSAVDKATYSEQERANLMAQAEEAAKNINQYKKRADFYSQLTSEDKQQILDDNINRKLTLSKLMKTEDLERHSQDLEDLTVQTVANKRSESFTNSVRNYRDGINKIRQEREQAEQDAIGGGTYNPLVDHLENKTPTTTLASIQTVEDLEDAMTQALLTPDRGKDLVAFLNGLFDQQLEMLEQNTEDVTQSYLETVGKKKVKSQRTEVQPDGSVDSVSESRDPYDTDTAIADLTEEQQEELAELLSELNNQYDDILDRKNAVSNIMMQSLNNVAPKELLEIQDAEAREKAQVEWVKDLYGRVNDNYQGLLSIMESDGNFEQGVFYNRVRFAEYKADNKDKLDKEVDKRRQTREAQNPPAEVTERETVTTTEVSSETGKEVKVTSPGLAPEDITPEFVAGIEQLETMSLTNTVSEVSVTTGEVTATQEYNAERGEIISQLLGEVVASTSVESAQAKMRVIMETAGSTPEEINDTLRIMGRIANNEPVFEEDYTHMFNLLLTKANMDLNKLKFESAVSEPEVVVPDIVAPVQDNRSPEEIERTTVIPNVQLGSLKGKVVEYNGVRGVLQISEGGVVTVETDNVIYELENANATTSTLEHMIQEVTPELDSNNNDDIISENEVILDGVEYLIETDARGTVVGLRDKQRPQKRITKNKLLIRAEVLRNRLEHQVITDAIEETPELIEAIAETVQALPSAQVVENLFNFNMTENVASAIDKLYENGNNQNLNEAELLETELWIMDTWYKLDDLVKEYPSDEVYQNALENLLIINKLLYNGKQAKSGRKVTPQKSTKEKETRVAPRKTESQATGKSAVTKESAKPKQLNLFVDQPRLTPEQVAERETMEARQREIDREEAMAEEELYMEYMQEKEAFKMLDLPVEAQALEGNRIDIDSFVDFASRADIEGKEGKVIEYAYLDKKGKGIGVDEAARIASGFTDTEVTPADIIDFILTYPGGIGSPSSRNKTTYFGRNNPDFNPRYAGIVELAKSRSKAEKAKKARKKKLSSATTTFSGDFNVAETKDNTTKTTEVVKREPKTEAEVSQVETQNQIVSTTKLFRPTSETAKNAVHFEIQERIIESVDKEFRTARTAVVDLFTIIEQVLGTDTIIKMEEIFDEVQSGPTPERLQALRSQFLWLFPAHFMDVSKLEYMFDTQIVKNVSQSDLTQTNVKNLNATEEEIYQVNKGRNVPEAKLKDGRIIKDTIVRQSNGKLFLLKTVDLLDANGNAVKDAEGKPMVDKTWIRFDQLANPTEILAYPIMGTQPMTFTALNTLAFTVLDSEGKVQKYDNNGGKTESGNKALINYLPTSKAKANPTPEQKAFDSMRVSVSQGERVVHNVNIVGPSRSDSDITLADKTVKKGDYNFTFSTETLTPLEKTLPPAEVLEEKAVAQSTTRKGSQEESVAALEALVAKAKTIPDPSKEGYLIDGERYERQSGFTKRVLGKVQIDTEDSTQNKEKGAAVGNFLDIIGRDVLGGRKVKSRKDYIKEAEEMALNSKLNGGKGYKLEVTDEQFNDLVKELEDFRKELTRKGYKLFTEGLVVYRKYTAEEKAATGFVGVAGAMDIVAIDAEGGVHIIDFKNKKFKNAETFKSNIYNSNERFPSSVSGWSSQQTTYGVLSFDFGLPIRSVNILLFASQYQEAGGTITINMLSKGSDKVSVLAQNQSDISNSVIRLKSDGKIAKQIELRTVNPKSTKAKEPTTADLNTVKENIPEFTDSEAKNVSLILSLYDFTMADTKGLDPSDETPDTKNPPVCNPPI